MNAKYPLCIAIISIISAGCGSVSNPDSAVNKLEVTNNISVDELEQIASVLSTYPDGTQIAIGFIENTTATFYGALRGQDTLKTVHNRHAVFEIGSLTKVFTSTLLAHFDHQDKLDINDSIQRYVDFTLSDSIDITFKQLSNHTSGLPRIPSGFIWESLFNLDNPYKNYDEEKLRNYMRQKMELKTQPGFNYQYSNIGAGMLGYLLTKIDGRSYEELIQQIVFEPLNMESSTTIRKQVQERLIACLTKRGGIATNWDFGSLQGAGAILSTVDDLSQFVKANFDPANEELKLQRMKTFTVDDEMDMALGWHTLKRGSGARWHWHNGGTGGYRS